MGRANVSCHFLGYSLARLQKRLNQTMCRGAGGGRRLLTKQSVMFEGWSQVR